MLGRRGRDGSITSKGWKEDVDWYDEHANADDLRAVGIAEDAVGMAEDAVGMAEDAVGMAEDAVGMAEGAVGIAEDVVGIAVTVGGMAECVNTRQPDVRVFGHDDLARG